MANISTSKASADLERLVRPMTTLENLRGHELVPIDDVQRRPDMFPVLRVLIDRDRRPGQYLLRGSASHGLGPGRQRS